VALSYFAALGLAVLVFIELGNSGGITFILPFLLFIFLLALGGTSARELLNRRSR